MNWYKDIQVPSYEKAIVVLAKKIAEYDPDQFSEQNEHEDIKPLTNGYYETIKPLIATLISNINKIYDLGEGTIYSQGCDRQIIIEAKRLLGGLASPQSHTIFNKLVVLNETVRNCSQ